MPKEITHIALAEALHRHLPPDSLFHGPVKTHLHLFLYGSVAPDVPYFYVWGPDTKAIQKLTQPFHTSDATALVSILNFLNRFPEKDPGALAFAAGLCCHILSDTHFHPMVYYFAGMDDVHQGATTRHRFFETAMDLHFRQFLRDKRRASLGFLYRHLEMSRGRFSYLFRILFGLRDGQHTRYLDRSIRYHQRIQTLFLSSFVYNIIRGLTNRGIIRQRRFLALCYPDKYPSRLAFFNRPVSYQDPCRGSFHTHTMEHLTQLTVARSIRLLDIIERAMSTGGRLLDAVRNPDLPEIRPCPADDVSDFKYWHQKDSIEEMLFRPYNEKGE